GRLRFDFQEGSFLLEVHHHFAAADLQRLRIISEAVTDDAYRTLAFDVSIDAAVLIGGADPDIVKVDVCTFQTFATRFAHHQLCRAHLRRHAATQDHEIAAARDRARRQVLHGSGAGCRANFGHPQGADLLVRLIATEFVRLHAVKIEYIALGDT